MKRIDKFFADMRGEGLSNYDIAAGLGNGDIERPEWISIAESTDHMKVWDNEDKDASAQMGFVWLSYEDDEEDED